MRLAAQTAAHRDRESTRAGSFGSDDPASLASWLLDEISRGMVPVWPSTRRCADRIAVGLGALREGRRLEVDRAVSLAPTGGSLDWSELLAAV
jgi:hypothetical protein